MSECECTPKWIARITTYVNADVCPKCKKAIAGKTPSRYTFYLFPCGKTARRIHIRPVVLHPECAGAFYKRVRGRGWLRGVDRVSDKVDNLKKRAWRLRRDCFARHIRTGGQCARCGTYAEKGNIQLRACAQCIRTLYCSRICQKRDWLCHKLVCQELRDQP